MARVIKILDSENSDYDLYFTFPDGMTPDQANETVSNIIYEIKDSDTDGYTYDVLETELAKHGIRNFAVDVIADAEW